MCKYDISGEARGLNSGLSLHLHLYSMYVSSKDSGESVHMRISDFSWDFGKLPFPAHLGKYIIKNGKISTKIHEIGKVKTIFGLGMTPL